MKTLCFCICIFFSALFCTAQKFEAEVGYKLNNDFTIYYKDLKPFYYSGITVDLLIKHKKSEFLIGGRYMPFLNSFKPELGYNYYLRHDPEQKFNYFLHTTVFFNNYSYNNQVGYENYYYVYNKAKTEDYASARFTSFVHDIALGVKMGVTPRWTLDFMVGSGYFYGTTDYSEGELVNKLKDEYWGIQYNFRFAVKYVLAERKREEADE
jgi:hypothetical protein